MQNARSAAATRLAMFLLFALTYVLSAVGQESQQKTRDLESLRDEKLIPAIVQPAGVALESTVDPERYVVGPSDRIAVNIWLATPLSFSLTVTPEGTLIIPTVGEVRVAHLTLVRARAAVLGAIKKRYLQADVSVTLVIPRPIVVSVTGMVMNSGHYTLTAVDRADKAIELANELKRLQEIKDLEAVKYVASKRSILLRHRDGTEQRVDLLKFFAAQIDECNPYLREGDVVIIPRIDPRKNVFAVYGQVNTPGRFEFVAGDSLTDAVRIAHGLTPLGMGERAIFSRLNADGTALTSREVDIPAILAGTQPNILLEPGDRIVVQRRADQREDYNVDVRGEVRFPGTYPITKNHTRLSEVIRQAGGFTENAALHFASLTRQTFSREDAPEEELISMRGIVSSQDTIGYALETMLRISREAVTVDFVKLLANGDSTQDVILQAEDQIEIPTIRSTVYVFGQVTMPGHIMFIEHADAGYYVGKAGGYSERASRGDVKIIKARTKQWLAPGETIIEPGDHVWVPAEPDHPFSYTMNILSQSANILSVVLGVAVIIVTISK